MYGRDGERAMTTGAAGRARFGVAAAACFAAVVYVASPYVALWRVGVALRSHDVALLRSSIDWVTVRDGLKQELTGGTTETGPGTVVAVKAASTVKAADDDELPEFGESFAKTAVSNVVDEDCDAEHVEAMLGSGAHRSEGVLAEVRRSIDWAFFTGPQTFVALLRVSDDPREGPVRVRMVFSRSHGWRVDNVWLPQQMLSPADAHAT